MIKNEKQLKSFTEYCKSHPEERFWQALRNWSKNQFILKAKGVDWTQTKITYTDIEDTFYEE